jgi:hypothetical protein
MPAELLPETRVSTYPDRMVILVEPGLETESLAQRAVYTAQLVMPKVTGYMVTTLRPISGDNFFGIYFPDRRIWFLEQGTRPFTMRSLAGKTIPMWINDPTGSERRANPKAKTRTTVDGRTQVLIFRRAAKHGARKTVSRRAPDGSLRTVTVPASYPGAAGRIKRREAAQPLTTPSRVGGRIARGNVGVRWRHPGTSGRNFLNYAMTVTAWAEDLRPSSIYLADSASISTLTRRVGGVA